MGAKVRGPPIESRVTLPFPVPILYIHFDNALMIVRVREVIISQVHGDIGVSNRQIINGVHFFSIFFFSLFIISPTKFPPRV